MGRYEAPTAIAPDPASESDVESEDEERGLTSATWSKEDFSSNMDVFWLMVIRVLHLWDSKDGSSQAKLQARLGLVHGLVLYSVNLFLQISITFCMLLGAARLEHPLLETTFQGRHHVNLEEGAQMILAAARSGNSTLALSDIVGECNDELGVKYQAIYSIIIFMWLLTMLVELKEVTRDYTAIMGVPDWEPGMKSLFSEDNKTVVALPRSVRTLFLFAVPFMRCSIAIVVLCSGCKFLIFQNSMLDLVIKSLCMGYVLRIDEVILSALSGDATKTELKNLKLQYVQRMTIRLRLWNHGLGGLIHCTLAVVYTWLIVYWNYGRLMHFRAACWQYHYAFPEVLHSRLVGFEALIASLTNGHFP